MFNFASLKKTIPLEVLPLGVAVVVVTSLASYRLFKASKSPEVIIKRDDAEKWDKDFSSRKPASSASDN